MLILEISIFRTLVNSPLFRVAEYKVCSVEIK